MPTILPGSVVVVTVGGVLVPGSDQYLNEHSLTTGDDTFTVDYSVLGLSVAPVAVAVFGSVSKTAAGQANLYGTYIEGSKSANAATFELNAPCDVTGRVFYYIVILHP